MTSGEVIAAAVQEGVVLGLGNPLLDIITAVNPDVLIDYELKANDAILAEEKHASLYKEITENFDAEYLAGGSTQNTIRFTQWMVQRDGATAFFGAIGDDKFGKTMMECCTKDGVKAQYFVNEEVGTGVCAVLVTDGGKCRSLVTDLKAADTYPLTHLRDQAQWSVVQKSSIFYIAGFFLTVSPESISAIGEHALKESKTLCMNLSAQFLFDVPIFFKRFQAILPYVDVYFGNETEARSLAKAMNWNTRDVREIAILLSKACKHSARPRTVVFSQGADPTIVVIGDKSRLWSVEQYPVIPIKLEDVVDTNGAGDAFVGGFLCGMLQGLEVKESVKLGHYAANIVIKRSGCSLPENPRF